MEDSVVAVTKVPQTTVAADDQDHNIELVASSAFEKPQTAAVTDEQDHEIQLVASSVSDKNFERHIRTDDYDSICWTESILDKSEEELVRENLASSWHEAYAAGGDDAANQGELNAERKHAINDDVNDDLHKDLSGGLDNHMEDVEDDNTAADRSKCFEGPNIIGLFTNNQEGICL
ncbi:hypothetical protein B0T26DRAFT_674348 [Lasiosphaeria miniovina]|uniref:Uncharacterized protein n=1 Tax=Lasiosphaeria miniovina TaxID=1954250 RepID=A0AA40AVE4_9PEZI|nr:uncharacterized protein B0T26DRAFT_674348 [Lasiosphaeria miniovina]KAK0722669.1 hypothetical protein B0T26DRAFT_674348 [Lasiosphaeria miniovina]